MFFFTFQEKKYAVNSYKFTKITKTRLNPKYMLYIIQNHVDISKKFIYEYTPTMFDKKNRKERISDIG